MYCPSRIRGLLAALCRFGKPAVASCHNLPVVSTLKHALPVALTLLAGSVVAADPLPGQEVLRQQERERVQRELLEPSPDVRFELPRTLFDSDRLPKQETPCFAIPRRT